MCLRALRASVRVCTNAYVNSLRTRYVALLDFSSIPLEHLAYLCLSSSCSFFHKNTSYPEISVPFSARTQRKAIKSRATAVDSPQILELTIKIAFLVFSSISSSTFVIIVSLCDSTFRKWAGNQIQAQKKDAENSGCLKRRHTQT